MKVWFPSGRFRKIVKSDNQLLRVCPSIGPSGITQFPLDEFSSNLIFDYFSKIGRENLSFIKFDKNKMYFS